MYLISLYTLAQYLFFHISTAFLILSLNSFKIPKGFFCRSFTLLAALHLGVYSYLSVIVDTCPYCTESYCFQTISSIDQDANPAKVLVELSLQIW